MQGDPRFLTEARGWEVILFNQTQKPRTEAGLAVCGSRVGYRVLL